VGGAPADDSCPARSAVSGQRAMSTAGFITAGLWTGALAFVAVMVVSLRAGAVAEWAVLRGLGAFVVFLTLSVIAEAIARQGVQSALRNAARRSVQSSAPQERQRSAAGSESLVEDAPVLEPELLTAGEDEEDVNARKAA